MPTALVLAAIGLLWSGAIQLHPPIGWVDPGLYVYWFETPAENAALRQAEYHGGRLPFVLAGVVLYRLLDAANAQAVLVTAFFALGALAAYAVACTRLATSAGRITVTLACVFNPLWIAAYTRGYVDGPAIAASLGALACVIPAGERRARARLATSGGLLTAAAFLHPFAGGAACLAVLAARGAGRPRSLAADLPIIGVGSVLAFLLLAGAGTLVGIPFLASLEGMLPALRATAGGIGHAFVQPPGQWVPGAPRLIVVPLLLAVAAAALCGVGASKEEHAAERPLLAAGFVFIGVVIAFQALSGFPLQFSYYASYLLLAAPPLLTLLAARTEERGALRTAWPAILLAGILVGFLLTGLALPLSARKAPSFAMLTWLAVGVATAAALLALLLRRHLAALLLAGAVLGLTGAVNRDTEAVLRLADAPDLAAQHRAMGALRAVLDEVGTGRARYHVWFGRDRFAQRVGLTKAETYTLSFRGEVTRLNALDSLAASLGWHITALGFNMPEVGPEERRILDSEGDGTTELVTLCAEMADCEEGLTALAANGFAATPLVRRRVVVPGARAYAVLIARITAVTSSRPKDEAIRDAFEALLMDGPSGDLLRREGIVVRAVRDSRCVGDGRVSVCGFDYLLSSGESRAMELVLERTGRVWRRVSQSAPAVIATLSPDHGALKQALIASMKADLVLRDRITVTTIADVACEGSAEAARCSLDYLLSTEETGRTELMMRRPGRVWRRASDGQAAPAPSDEPDAMLLASVFQDILLTGPTGEEVRRDRIGVIAIPQWTCEGALSIKSCRFTFELSSGEHGVSQLTLRRTPTGWRRAA